MLLLNVCNRLEVDFLSLCRTQHSNFNSEGFWKVEGEWKVVDAGRELPFLLAEHDKIRHKVLLLLLVSLLILYIVYLLCHQN